ncbi:MAG: hypothetical protein QG614_64 [Patescibacteria group bacterium]|nr:hypothetical protein [Patescibacteria group bacterium]
MKRIITIVASLPLLFGFVMAQYQGDYNPNPYTSACINLSNNFGRSATDYNTNYEVSKLQDFLQGKGFLNTDPTGYYGRLTEAAVRSYQSSKNISSTGYVGPLTRAAITSDTCGGIPPVGPVACTMDAKMCSDGSYVGRVGPNCDFAACPNYSNYCTLNTVYYSDSCVCPVGSTKSYNVNSYYGAFTCQNAGGYLQDYSVDMQIYSNNLGKYLTKNSNGYYDAAGVNGNTNFTVTTSNSAVSCSVEHRSGYGSYYYLSNQKYFTSTYNSNGTGLDYYRVTCGDDVYNKKIVKEFIVETNYSNNNLTNNINFNSNDVPSVINYDSSASTWSYNHTPYSTDYLKGIKIMATSNNLTSYNNSNILTNYNLSIVNTNIPSAYVSKGDCNTPSGPQYQNGYSTMMWCPDSSALVNFDAAFMSDNMNYYFTIRLSDNYGNSKDYPFNFLFKSVNGSNNNNSAYCTPGVVNKYYNYDFTARRCECPFNTTKMYNYNQSNMYNQSTYNSIESYTCQYQY